MNYRLWTINHGLWTNYGLTMDYKPWTNYGLSTMDYQPWTINYGPSTTNLSLPNSLLNSLGNNIILVDSFY